MAEINQYTLLKIPLWKSILFWPLRVLTFPIMFILYIVGKGCEKLGWILHDALFNLKYK